jgi:hypothetical protein
MDLGAVYEGGHPPARSALLDEDVDQSTPLARTELDPTVAQGEKGVVPATPDVVPGMEMSSALADDYRPGSHRGAVENLHPETLRSRVPPVAGGAATFGLGHRFAPGLYRLMPVISIVV